MHRWLGVRSDRTLVAAGLLALLPVGACAPGSEHESPSLTQEALDDFASALRFRLSVLENATSDCLPEARFGICHRAELALENTGSPFSNRGWTLYFSSLHRALSGGTNVLRLTHLGGTRHAVSPAPAFSGWATSETKTLEFQADGCLLSEGEALPRAYIAAAGLRPVVIPNTDSEEASNWLEPLTQDNQTHCGAYDTTVVASPASRFEENAANQVWPAAEVAAQVVPALTQASQPAGTLELAHGLTIDAPDLDSSTLAAVIARLRLFGVDVNPDGRPVQVSIDATDPAFDGRAVSEAYHMKVEPDGVEIVGGDAAGAFYGLQTLISLIPAGGDPKQLPALDVAYDAPRYAYRGIQVDVARNFHGPEEILRLIEVMAAYKLNALHLHLSDDEGFRLAIPGLPELTDIGSRRCHGGLDERCLDPELGSGPSDTTSGSGSFTRSQFVDILRAAAAAHIEVVPEFDLPGHARAAIQSMRARAENGDPTLLLSEPKDTSEYLSNQSFNDGVANACLESTYVFAATLMDEVSAMYADAGSVLRTWHVGADEVPQGAWTQSPACEDLFASGNGPGSAEEVLAYFLRRMNDLAHERGVELRAWSDGVVDNPSKATSDSARYLEPSRDLSSAAFSLNWATPLRWFDGSLEPLLSLGYHVVLTNADYLYLDQPQEAYPAERGLPWATRRSDTRKVFSYVSGNLAANAETSADCANDACAATLVTARPIAYTQNILGIEAALWTETVRTDEQLEAMVLPRLLAVAERAWHRAAWEPADDAPAATLDTAALEADWARFASTLGFKELPKLEQAGVRYRIDVPGARIAHGRLEANLAFPGFAIEYRAPGDDFAAYDPADPPALQAAEVRAVAASGRVGRSAVVP